MTNDPTTTPNGEADMPKITRGRAGGSRNSGGNDHPGMMGDGTEEQNLNQAGNPSARITEGEVQAAFGGAEGAKLEDASGSVGAKASRAATRMATEARSFAGSVREDAGDYYDHASDAAANGMSALTDRINSMRDQVQQSADAARSWAMKQADVAKQTAQDKPMLVISVSAGVAMAVGLMAGFVIGRATADEY